MAVAGWFQIGVGIAIVGLWSMLVATRQVPQIAEGKCDIWFHLVAELLTAVALIVGGVWLLVAGTTGARTLSAVALGALLYTAVNSPGYYADRGDWATVAMFGVLVAGTTAAAITLLLDAAS